MKGSFCRQKKSKPTTALLNNNFSQKYLHYTRERRFLTPKKDHHTRTSYSKEHSSKKEIGQKLKQNPFSLTQLAKSSKININMEIKNLNIYGTSPHPTAPPKKKLHKKTISALGKHQKDLKEREPQQPLQQSKKKPQHGKTRSQENVKMSPQEWADLLKKHGQTKKDSESVISKWSWCNRKGMAVDKKDKANQDTWMGLENFMMKGRFLLGVCDGHGVNGHYVSEFVKQILPENIEYFFIKNKALKKNELGMTESAIKDAFKKTASDLEQSDIDINFSGTTTCLLYLHDHKLTCANLGDSRAIVYSRKGQKWLAKPISCDHKAEDSREATRIKMNGGRVFPYFDEDGQQMGPLRVWIRDKEIPGLAMTRSFGDYVASTVGVISQPEVTHYEVTEQDRFVVVASDGLWEFLSNEQVMELVIPAFVRNNSDQAISILQNRAVARWRQEDENIDDITIIVIFFKYY